MTNSIKPTIINRISPSAVKLTAPAKVNLWLDIKAKRPDGYHDIESVMQTVTLCDELTLERLPDAPGKRKIAISCSVTSLACDESNICYRAAQEFMSLIGKTGYSIDIHIEKQIPIAAGLAGGSTDAAATLIGLNELYGAGFSREELAKLGAKLGADVPFCVTRGIRVTRGIGDRLSPCAKMPDCSILIACDGEGVSTPKAYGRLDELYDFNSRAIDVESFCKLLDTGDIRVIAGGMHNIFESAVLPIRERAVEILEAMKSGGAIGAIMSGSGPSVFGVFDDASVCEAVKSSLEEKGIRAFICEPYYECQNI